MDSPLQLFRELLPFGPSSAEQKSAAAVRGLLDTIAGLSPQETVAKLATSVLPTLGQQPNMHMRFKLLEDIRHEAEHALPTLEQDITQAVLPLPIEVTTAALHADNLLKGMSIAYAGIARSINKGQLELHDLHQMVRGPLVVPLNGETAPVEHEYLGALLFAYLEPSKLPRTELEIINTCSRQLAAYAVICDVPADAGTIRHPDSCFLVRPDEGTPGYPLSRLPANISTFGSLLIDCSQVLAALDRNITRRPGKTVEPDLNAPPAILQSLRVAIGGKSARRFSRTHFRPRGDLVSGFGSVVSFLDGNTFSRRAVDSSTRYDGRAFSASEWALVDESPDGFRLRYIKGEKRQLGAGDIVALQPRESSKIHVCLVRRISSTQVRLEIGLQLMSPQVSVVDVSIEDALESRAIFLHSLPAYGKHSGLITLPGHHSSGQKVRIKLPGRSLHRQLGTCMEANEGLEFFTLEQLPD